ncbi:unnamed protein product, partial [Heterotrigona itama]
DVEKGEVYSVANLSPSICSRPASSSRTSTSAESRVELEDKLRNSSSSRSNVSSVAVEVEIGTANNEPIGRSGDGVNDDDDNNAKDEDAHGKRNGKKRSQPVESSRSLASPLGTHHVSDIEFGRLFGSACHIHRLHFSRAVTGCRSRRVFSLRWTFPMVLRRSENCAQRPRVSTHFSVSGSSSSFDGFMHADSRT